MLASSLVLGLADCQLSWAYGPMIWYLTGDASADAHFAGHTDRPDQPHHTNHPIRHQRLDRCVGKIEEKITMVATMVIMLMMALMMVVMMDSRSCRR